MKRKLLTLIIILLTLFFVIGCDYADYTGNLIKEKETIKIGFATALTGDVGHLGQNALKAAQLAADEINAEGGINGKKIELIAEDTKCQGKEAASAVNKLIYVDKVDFIIGPCCSSAALSAAPIAESSKTILISPCASSPELTHSGNHIFRLVPSDVSKGKYAAEFIYNELNIKKVATLTCNNDYCEGLKKTFISNFKSLGGEVIISEVFPQSSTDLRSQITKIKKIQPELVYVISYTDSGISFLRQSNELELNSKILSDEMWSDTILLENTKEYNEGVMFTYTKSSDFFVLTQKMINTYGNNTEASYCSPESYDAVKIISEVLKKTKNEETSIVLDELYKIDYAGYSGGKSFDEHGDLDEAPFSVNILVNGEPTDYFEIN